MSFLSVPKGQAACTLSFKGKCHGGPGTPWRPKLWKEIQGQSCSSYGGAPLSVPVPAGQEQLTSSSVSEADSGLQCPMAKSNGPKSCWGPFWLLSACQRPQASHDSIKSLRIIGVQGHIIHRTVDLTWRPVIHICGDNIVFHFLRVIAVSPFQVTMDIKNQFGKMDTVRV